MTREPEAATVEAYFQELKENHAAIRPSALFRLGMRVPSEPVTLEELTRLLSSRSVTFVILPGLFSEFPPGKAFDEVFSDSKSSYAREWKKAFENHPAADPVFSLFQMKESDVGLDRLVRAASIDDAHGVPLLKAIRLDSPRMSLETLGDIRLSADRYLRRLEKFFSRMEAPETLVFLGHSRGAMTALEILSRFKSPSAPSWLGRIKGMVSLGGVTYGTEIADATNVQGTIPFAQVEPWRYLQAKLEPLSRPDLLPSVVNVVSARALVGFGGMLSDPRVNSDVISAMISTLRPGERPSGATLIRTLFGEFNPLDVRGNIQRYLTFTHAMLASIDELKTAGRIKWWRSHEVPAKGIRYYSLPAAMTTLEEDKEIATNPITYNDKSSDYKILTDAYKLFRDATGVALNDSHVEVARVAFRPKLHQLLNPKQMPLQTSYLGVLGTHHWALVLRSLSNRIEEGQDPFPRVALLKALAATVILDQERE